MLETHLGEICEPQCRGEQLVGVWGARWMKERNRAEEGDCPSHLSKDFAAPIGTQVGVGSHKFELGLELRVGRTNDCRQRRATVSRRRRRRRRRCPWLKV